MDKEKRDLMKENYKLRGANCMLEKQLAELKDEYEKLVYKNHDKYIEILRLKERATKKNKSISFEEVDELKEEIERQKGMLKDSTQTINSLKRDREYYKNKLKEVEQEYLDYKTYILNKYYKEDGQTSMIDHGFLRIDH